MRSKHIIALATFFTCFAISSLIVGVFFDNNSIDSKLYETVRVSQQTDSDAAEKILLVLRQDEENGAERVVDEFGFSVDSEFFPSLAVKAKVTAEYARKSARIVDAGLPSDFQFAWRRHMKAWSDYSNFLSKAEKAAMNTGDINRLETEYIREVDSSWFRVLRVARTYGADLSD